MTPTPAALAELIDGTARTTRDGEEYVVAELGQGERASITFRGGRMCVHWPWGQVVRKSFDCGTPAEVQALLADLSTTPYPEFDARNPNR